MGVLILFAALVSSASAPANPQYFEDSLAVRARERGGEYHVLVDACGGSLPFPQMVMESDIILHGTLAAERGRLSLDEGSVYTEYDVVPFRILKAPAASNRTGYIASDRIRVVLPGGSIEHEGLTITMTIDTVPHAERLRWGAEVVLFLTAHESELDVYRVTGAAWGAFRVLDGQVVAMTREVARIRGDKAERLPRFSSGCSGLSRRPSRSTERKPMKKWCGITRVVIPHRAPHLVHPHPGHLEHPEHLVHLSYCCVVVCVPLLLYFSNQWRR